MKINDVKHNHSLTELLKICLFSILMLLPFLNIAVRCGYVMLNKNAYQSAEITTTTTYEGATPIYQSNEVNSVGDVINNNIYSINFVINTIEEGQSQWDFVFKILEGNIIFSDFTSNIENDDGILPNNFDYHLSNNEGTMFLDWNSGVHVQIEIVDTIEFKDCIIQYGGGSISQFSYTQFNYTTWNVYNKEEIAIEATTLDNVFEYSLNKLEEEQYLTWTKNTAVYTGVNAMTSQLGITQNTLPMLITYWFFLVIIYVILDIVLKLFTTLTHMIGGKKST